MADTHDGESRATQTREKPDLDSLRAGLARMRSGDPAEAITPRMRDDEDANVDDTDDHGDAAAAQARPAKKPAAKPAKKPAPAPEPEDDDLADEPEADLEEEAAEVETELEDLEEQATADEAEAEVETTPEPEEPARPDPELERRAAQLRKQEQRQRERLRNDRAQLERDREELRASRAALDEFNKLKARAKYDPTGVLRHLGLTEDDFETAAKHIYSHSSAMVKDPKNRDAADRAMRERELLSTIDSLKSRLDKQDEERHNTARAEQERAEAVRYIGGVRKAARPGTLAAHYIGKGGAAEARALQTFATITAELAEDDDLPHPSDVLAEYERRRRAELEDDGVDVDALLKRKAAPAAKPATNGAYGKKLVAAPAKKPAATTAPVRRDPADPGPRRTIDPEQRKDEVLASLTAFRQRKQRAAVD